MSKRSRYFSGITYASRKQIQKVLADHATSLRSSAYILHDKDEAEPHYHILLRTHSNWTPQQIAKWFAGLTDKTKNSVNTFFENCIDMEAQKKYITHTDEESIKEGKHQYRSEDVISYNFQELTERKDCYDSSYEIIEKIIQGTSIRELARVYGRDYIYHHRAYSEVAENIDMQERKWIMREKNRYKQATFETIESMEDFDK